MSASRPLSDVDPQAFKAAAQDLLHRITSTEDPQELQAWRDLFRKSVPLFLRSTVGAYLFKQAFGRNLRRKGDMVSLFLSVGKNRRVYPRDLIGLLTSTVPLEKGQIGEIKILDNYSFVDVDPGKAEELIKALDGSSFRSRRLTVNYAKKREEGAERPARAERAERSERSERPEGSEGGRRNRRNRRDEAPRTPETAPEPSYRYPTNHEDPGPLEVRNDEFETYEAEEETDDEDLSDEELRRRLYADEDFSDLEAQERSMAEPPEDEDEEGR